MKKLMNLALANGLFTDGFDSDYDKVRSFVKAHGMDGIEMIIYGDVDLSTIPKDLIYGHHLLYWPNWMNFWRMDENQLMKDFLTVENVQAYYGVRTPNEMVAYLNQEFETAKSVEADYMVFHVSHCGFEEIFTSEHRYNDRDVMEAALELINQVFTGDGPLLLFENLWWPGLTYEDPELAEWFLEQVDYKNKGFLLDISHLMAAKAKDVISGVAYVHEVLDDLGPLAGHIKAIHLNKTIAGSYYAQDHSDHLKAYRGKSSLMERFKLIHEHISRIDSHMPFDDAAVNSIIDRVKPYFLVYEFMADSVKQLGERIDVQNRYLK